MSSETDLISKQGQLQLEDGCRQPERTDGAVQGPGRGALDDEAEFQADLANAIAEGKIFAVSEVDYKARVAKLIPKLAKLRKYTAQRQDDYAKGSRKGHPKWGTLLKFFRAETGVTLCDKTIKGLIDGHEGIKPAPRPKKLRATTITPAEARKMGLALLAVHEALSKVNDHGNVLMKPEDIALIVRMAPSPAKLNRIVEGLRDEAEGDTGNASGAAPDPDEAGCPRSTNPFPEEAPLPALKSGDAAGLAARVIEKCVPELHAVLGNLQPDAFAAALHCIATDIASEFRRPNLGRIAIKVQHIPTKPRGLSNPRFRPSPQDPSLFDNSAPSSQMDS